MADGPARRRPYNRRVRDDVLQQRVALSRIEKTTYRDLLDLYREALREVVREAERGLEGYRRERVDRLLAELRSRTRALARLGERLLDERVGKVRDLVAKDLFRSANGRLPKGAKELVRFDRVADLDIAAALAQRRPRRPFAKLPADQVLAAQRSIALSIALGEGAAKAARRLRARVAGLTKARALLIARTELQEAANVANDAFVEKNATRYKGVQHLATLDPRTCPICGELDGKFYRLGARRPNLPIHPGCRCVHVPVAKRLEDIFPELRKLKLGDDEDDARAEMDGEVPGRTTWKDWLAEKEAEEPGFALPILGRRRYELWKAGKLQLGDFSTAARGIKPLRDLERDLKKKRKARAKKPSPNRRSRSKRQTLADLFPELGRLSGAKKRGKPGKRKRRASAAPRRSTASRGGPKRGSASPSPPGPPSPPRSPPAPSGPPPEDPFGRPESTRRLVPAIPKGEPPIGSARPELPTSPEDVVYSARDAFAAQGIMRQRVSVKPDFERDRARWDARFPGASAYADDRAGGTAYDPTRSRFVDWFVGLAGSAEVVRSLGLDLPPPRLTVEDAKRIFYGVGVVYQEVAHQFGAALPERMTKRDEVIEEGIAQALSRRAVGRLMERRFPERWRGSDAERFWQGTVLATVDPPSSADHAALSYSYYASFADGIVEAASRARGRQPATDPERLRFLSRWKQVDGDGSRRVAWAVDRIVEFAGDALDDEARAALRIDVEMIARNMEEGDPGGRSGSERTPGREILDAFERRRTEAERRRPRREASTREVTSC